MTVARELSETGLKIDRTVRSSLSLPILDLVNKVDKLYNKKLELFGREQPVINLFENLQSELDKRTHNIADTIGLEGPYPKINELYGSLVRKGNITTICARAGSHKTTFLCHFGANMAKIHDIPIIHFDNGEMQPEELQLRFVAGLSGIPLYLIESGKYSLNKEATLAVKKAFEEVKHLRYYYVPVGGKTTSEMINLLRRLYYSKIGRDNPTLLIFDYWKSYNENSSKAEWEIMGQIVQEFKDCIHNEIPIGVIAGVQSNRAGIVMNKTRDEVVENEGIISGGDRIIFYSSHVFLLRKKTLDTLASEGNQYGNCVLVPLKYRHLGENIDAALNPVRMPDGSYRQNYIHFDINNFRVREVTDLATMVHRLGQLEIDNQQTETESEEI